jgi:rhodanese-related sulfurtransferase
MPSADQVPVKSTHSTIDNAMAKVGCPDPASPSHASALDPAKHLVLFCASGNRSASGAQTLKDIPQIQIPATRGVELSKKNNVYETIDGRVLVKAHGTTDMPI